MHQQAQIPLVVAILLGGLQMSLEVQDLGGQDSDLYFRRAGIRTAAGRFLGVRARLRRRRFRREEFVRIVAAERLNASLDVYSHAIFGVAVREADDTIDGLLRITVFLLVSLRRFLFRMRVCKIAIGVGDRAAELLGILQGFLELIFVEEVVQCSISLFGRFGGGLERL